MVDLIDSDDEKPARQAEVSGRVWCGGSRSFPPLVCLYACVYGAGLHVVGTSGMCVCVV